METDHRRNTAYDTFDSREDDNQKKEAVTMEEILDHVGFGWSQIKVLLACAIAYVSDGMEVMVITILGPTLAYEWHITPVQQALLTTCVFIGLSIGAPFFGYVSDNYGRRTSLILSSAWALIYSILIAIAPTYGWIVVLRMFIGMGIGGGMQVITYSGELLPQTYRGRLSVLPLGTWPIGTVLNVVAALALMRFSWRWWLLASALPTTLFLLCSPFLPESPRFQLASGRKQQAINTLKRMATENGNTLPDRDIQSMEVKPKAKIADLFVPKYRKTSILLIFAWFLIGFLYYGFVLFSTSLILLESTCPQSYRHNIGDDSQCPLELTSDHLLGLLWTAMGELPAMFLTIAVIDTLGRKLGATLESVLCGISCLLLNMCISRIPMMVILVSTRCLLISVFEITIIYTSEVYPTEVRSLAVGLGNSLSRIGTMVTPYFAQVLFDWSMHTALILYGVIAFGNALVFFLLPIETKGRPMAESLVK